MVTILDEEIRKCKDGNTRMWVKFSCGSCGSITWKEKRWIKNRKNIFCSQICASKHKQKRAQVICSNCGKKVSKKPAHIKNSKTGLFFCGKACKNDAQYNKHMFQRTKQLNCYKCGELVDADYRASRKLCNKCKPLKNTKLKPSDINDVLSGKIVIKYNNSIRRYLISSGIRSNKCEECGITSWNRKPLTIQIHHEDGNRYNNKIENLKMLCPNCHTQTKTWGHKKR